MPPGLRTPARERRLSSALSASGWGDEETEADIAVARLDDVVQPVRLNDPLHISGFRQVPGRYPLMHDDVAKPDIDGAIGRDSRADPHESRPSAKLQAAEQLQERRDRKDRRVQVVQFPVSVARAVVALMQESAEAVHDSAVRRIGKSFHGDHGDEKTRMPSQIDVLSICALTPGAAKGELSWRAPVKWLNISVLTALLRKRRKCKCLKGGFAARPVLYADAIPEFPKNCVEPSR